MTDSRKAFRHLLILSAKCNVYSDHTVGMGESLGSEREQA